MKFIRIMNTKLTISIENEIIKEAKVFASKRKTSLSKLIENYFKTLISDQKENDPITIIDEDILKISGSIRLPDSVDTKELLTDKLIKKYIDD